MKKTIISTAISAGLFFGASSAMADVTLTFADWQVPAAFTTQEGATVFMEKAKELSGGEIDFKYYPAEQLGKGGKMLRLIQTGVADISHVSPAYITDKFPLTTVSELPGMSLDSCALANAVYEMAQPGGKLYENEFKPNGIRLLFSGNLGPYSILTTEKPVKSVDDLAGLNMRTAGGPMEMTATALGANAIRMTGSETLPSLSRGTLDGLLWPIPLITDWGLEGSLNYMMPSPSTGSFVVTYSISERKWNSLSEKQQKALQEAGKYATQQYCEYVNNVWEKAKDDLEENYNFTSNTMPESEIEKAKAKFETVNQTWAKNLEDRGLPGKAVYKEFKERTSE
jgi:TRAP-type C4-dicarboxylate transport system substrate-binding protein